ncbi:hypothetical protein [Salinimicrobium gaetbulicola]|uniref:Uncharacterized protein n=1 Tax=Salinimicrobium gaetbulicola TaxID=999702 RepID=A0ABW3IGA9_9FLAO
MKPHIKEYIGAEAYKEVVHKFNGNREYEQVFETFLEDFLRDLEYSNDIEKDDTPHTLLEVPRDFINHYIKCREEGFGKTWSMTRADLKIMMDDNGVLFKCYEKVAATNKDQALKDLQVFCKTQKGDEIYTEFLIDRVINDDYARRPIENLAANYSKIYKQQIDGGKSEIYARKYADLMYGDEYQEIYCEDYAFAYEESLIKGKSEEYAELYGEKYASELINVKGRAGIYDDEESLEFARDKAKAFINGWEYATENKIKEQKIFIDCYCNAYLNTIYSDEWNSIKELEEVVLKKALEKFEKQGSLK